MELSASNRLEGTIKKLTMGKICTEVQLELSGGGVITALITTGAAERMNLQVGSPAKAIIKATNVIIGVA